MKKKLSWGEYVNRPKAGKVRKTYFSLYFIENDPNTIYDVKIMEHENCINIDEYDCLDLGNHYATKRDATAAMKRVIKAMRLMK
jgi:hypothetical protein